jgi:hypothetical protein
MPRWTGSRASVPGLVAGRMHVVRNDRPFDTPCTNAATRPVAAQATHETLPDWERAAATKRT